MRGLLALDLKQRAASSQGLGAAVKKVKPKSLQIFSRQFATMVEAGLNVVTALVILEEQTEDKKFAAVISEVRADVEGGLILSEALPATRGSFRGSTSRWSRQARRPESSTSFSTASPSRSRRRRRSGAGSRAR